MVTFFQRFAWGVKLPSSRRYRLKLPAWSRCSADKMGHEFLLKYCTEWEFHNHYCDHVLQNCFDCNRLPMADSGNIARKGY
jgi:hypothetical protein